MSKSGQEAKDLKVQGAAEEQLRSDVKELAPESGTEEAAAVRGKVQALSEAGEQARPTLTLEDALEEYAQVAQGDHTAADKLCHKYGSKQFKFIKRIPNAPDGGPGWHAEGREDGPLTLAQSTQLAEAINGKIDLEKMHADAEKNRAKRERQGEGKEKTEVKAAEAKAIDPEILKDLTAAIESAEDFKKLTELVHYCRRHNFVNVTMEGHKWKVEAKEDLEGSHELAQAINSKKNALIKAIYQERAREQRKKEAQERLERRLAGIKNVIDEKESDAELERLVWQFLVQKLGLVKKVPLANRDWTVEAIADKEGSAEVVKWVLDRKKELAALKARQDLDNLLSKHRR